MEVQLVKIAFSTFVPKGSLRDRMEGLLSSENSFTLSHGKPSTKERVKTH